MAFFCFARQTSQEQWKQISTTKTSELWHEKDKADNCFRSNWVCIFLWSNSSNWTKEYLLCSGSISGLDFMSFQKFHAISQAMNREGPMQMTDKTLNIQWFFTHSEMEHSLSYKASFNLIQISNHQPNITRFLKKNGAKNRWGWLRLPKTYKKDSLVRFAVGFNKVAYRSIKTSLLPICILSSCVVSDNVFSNMIIFVDIDS